MITSYLEMCFQPPVQCVVDVLRVTIESLRTLRFAVPISNGMLTRNCRVIKKKTGTERFIDLISSLAIGIAASDLTGHG